MRVLESNPFPLEGTGILTTSVSVLRCVLSVSRLGAHCSTFRPEGKGRAADMTAYLKEQTLNKLECNGSCCKPCCKWMASCLAGIP